MPTGGIFSGQAALIALSGARMESMLRVRDAAMAGDFADALKAAGGGSHAAGLGSIDKRMVEMPEHVKSLGNYQATVRLHEDVSATVDLQVVAAKKK
mgnify:CR=1 FL=1